MAILGILVALLLPALQGAREAARRTQCANHLKQIGLASVAYEQTHKQFANDLGSMSTAVNSWLVAILPQLGEVPLFNSWARAMNTRLAPSNFALFDDQKFIEIIQTPVSDFYCPTRRPAAAYPCAVAISAPYHTIAVTSASRTDYALNGGGDAQPVDSYMYPQVGLPGIWEAATTITSQGGKSKIVRSRDVKDGLSKTYLAAEKMIPVDAYENGAFWGDQGSIFACSLGDCVRFAQKPPEHDVTSHFDNSESCWACHSFGSAHSSTWNTVFCDGSVHSLSFSMSFATHRSLASRAGGDTPDQKEYR
jgi:type II secretory pathway pseudopilin PulG